jgi:hypothetical protein
MSESIDWTQPSEAILDQLLETVERRIPADKSRDDTAWVQLNRIAHVFDSSILKEMKQSLVRNGYEDFYQILIGGDDFGKPKVQAILDALGQVDPAVFTLGRVETMKSWGVERKPRWMFTGFSEPPTLSEVEFRKGRELAIASTAQRLNAASEARREAIDDATKTGEEIENATVEAFD